MSSNAAQHCIPVSIAKLQLGDLSVTVNIIFPSINSRTLLECVPSHHLQNGFSEIIRWCILPSRNGFNVSSCQTYVFIWRVANGLNVLVVLFLSPIILGYFSRLLSTVVTNSRRYCISGFLNTSGFWIIDLRRCLNWIWTSFFFFGFLFWHFVFDIGFLLLLCLTFRWSHRLANRDWWGFHTIIIHICICRRHISHCAVNTQANREK